jgi:hypothetical protein
MAGRPAAAARREYKQLFGEILELLKPNWHFLCSYKALWLTSPTCYGSKT